MYVHASITHPRVCLLIARRHLCLRELTHTDTDTDTDTDTETERDTDQNRDRDEDKPETLPKLRAAKLPMSRLSHIAVCCVRVR